MKIWILQTGEPLHIDQDNSRTMRGMNLANKLVEKGHNVILWSSTFNHRNKSHRFSQDKVIKINENLELILIHSPGYQSNVSFKRIYDHFILGIKLNKVLKTCKDKPDVAFLGYPPIEINHFMSNYLKRYKIPYVLDVKDQWPEFFLEPFPKLLKPILKIAIFPYILIAKNLMRNATSVSTMSQGYLDWIYRYSWRKKNSLDKVLPLTTQVEINENNGKFVNKFNLKFSDNNILFAGTHYPSLNFDPIFEVFRIFQSKNIKCNLIICGDGEMHNRWKEKAKELSNVFFTGWIEKKDIHIISQNCIATIVPLKNIDNYINNIPNKIIDSFSMGLPVICSLRGDVKELIEKEKVGFYYDDQNPQILNRIIQNIIDKKHLRNLLKSNVKKLYDKKFEFNTVYNEFIEHLRKIANYKND
jgi:glycosyltransferase involved in cell wall biosynthesis